MSPYLQRKPLTVFIIEDNPGDCMLLRELLGDTEIPIDTVEECPDMETAIERLATQKPDIVFLDLFLPDSVGLESYKALQELLGNTAVIILSGMSDMMTAHEAIALGAQDYLEKGDFDPKLLERTMMYAIERVKNNESLRIANERYSLVARATRDLIWDWDLATNKVFRDEQAVREVYGISSFKDIEYHEEWRKRVHPEDLGNLLERLEHIRNTASMDLFEVEYRFLTDNGTYKHIYDRGYITRNAEGQATRFIGAAQDITEKRKLEWDLRNAEVKTRRAVAQATIKGQENERKQLGLELHDNVTQILATSCLFIDHALSGHDVNTMLQKSRELIVLTTQELRKLSHHLLPPSADFGLKKALEKITSDLETTGLTFEKNWQAFDESLMDHDQQLTVYRIVQEQLNNILKHAQAKHIRVSLRSSRSNKNLIRLSISDDGVGFDLLKQRNGVGLRNIITRADIYEGRVCVDSRPGAGCKLSVVFPARVGDPKKVRKDAGVELFPD